MKPALTVVIGSALDATCTTVAVETWHSGGLSGERHRVAVETCDPDRLNALPFVEFDLGDRFVASIDRVRSAAPQGAQRTMLDVLVVDG